MILYGRGLGGGLGGLSLPSFGGIEHDKCLMDWMPCASVEDWTTSIFSPLFVLIFHLCADYKLILKNDYRRNQNNLERLVSVF